MVCTLHIHLYYVHAGLWVGYWVAVLDQWLIWLKGTLARRLMEFKIRSQTMHVWFLHKSCLAKMDKTKWPNVTQLLQTARLMPLIVSSLELYPREQLGEMQDFPSENQFSLSACDIELSCNNQAGLIVWLLMGILDKHHSLEEQIDSNRMATTFTYILAKSTPFNLLLSVSLLSMTEPKQLVSIRVNTFCLSLIESNPPFVAFNLWACGIIVSEDSLFAIIKV